MQRPKKDTEQTGEPMENRSLLEELLAAELRHLRIRNLQAEEDLIAGAASRKSGS